MTNVDAPCLLAINMLFLVQICIGWMCMTLSNVSASSTSYDVLLTGHAFNLRVHQPG